MLRKQIYSIEEISNVDQSLPVIIQITRGTELNTAFAVLETCRHSLRGIALSQHLLERNNIFLPPFITYLRIYVEDLSTITALLKAHALKKRLIEVFIPVSMLQNDTTLLEHCDQAHRIVINLTARPAMPEQQDAVINHQLYTQLYSQFLLMSKYPLFTGAAFCMIPPEHCYEFFDQINTIIPAKPHACASCLFIKHCSSNTKGFTPKPLIDTIKYNDAITFLTYDHNSNPLTAKNTLKNENKHENTAPRF